MLEKLGHGENNLLRNRNRFPADIRTIDHWEAKEEWDYLVKKTTDSNE